MNRNDLRQTERASVSFHGGRIRTVQVVFLALLLPATGNATAASDPEIIRVQVPAKSTSRCFPPGTELRILPVEAFESLVKRSSAKLERRLSAEPPRLVRARHRARWDGEVLRGETDLEISKSAAGAVGLSAGRLVAGGAFGDHASRRGVRGGGASGAAFRRGGG